MRVLDLFSGIGGFSLGFERAGMKTVRFVECDPKARAVLAHHWPDVPIWPDIKTYEAQEHEADVVCGGFPCQRFSTAARGRNIAEDLWPYMRDVIAVVRPVWVVAENVPRVGHDYPCGELEEIGYTVWPLTLDASPRGRRHRRRRAVFVAYANANGEPKCPIDAEVEKLPGGSGRDWRHQSAPLGMAAGIPGWMDRCALLGNSFSPIVAEGIGRAIMETQES